jgi:hypothetical protein
MAQPSGVFPALSDQVRKTIVDFANMGLNELDPVHKKLFGLKSTTRKFERMQSIAPFGAMPAKGEGEEYSFDQIMPGYSKDLTPIEYGFGFLWTETAEEDDEYDVLAQKSRWLGFSARVLQETLAAQVFINGFSTQTTADGIALFATNHSLKRGGTVKNELSTPADLSVTSLTRMRSDMRTNTKLESGQLVTPSKDLYLVHHPDNEGLAHRIVHSNGLQGTADNDTNHIKDLLNITPLTWDYLDNNGSGDADAWFLVGKKTSAHGLKHVSRKAPTLNPEAVDPKSGSRLVTIRMREVFDSFDWRNTAGTEGA